MSKRVGGPHQTVLDIVGICRGVAVPVRHGQPVIVGIVSVGRALPEPICFLDHAPAKIIAVACCVAVFVDDCEPIAFSIVRILFRVIEGVSLCSQPI